MRMLSGLSQWQVSDQVNQSSANKSSQEGL